MMHEPPSSRFVKCVASTRTNRDLNTKVLVRSQASQGPILPRQGLRARLWLGSVDPADVREVMLETPRRGAQKKTSFSDDRPQLPSPKSAQLPFPHRPGKNRFVLSLSQASPEANSKKSRDLSRPGVFCPGVRPTRYV